MSIKALIPITILLFSISLANLGPEDVSVLLKMHNDERSLSSLGALVWDAGLEGSATQWANTCPNGHSSDDLRKGAAENLGWGWPTMNGSAVVAAWIAEKADLVNGVCNPGKQCGHYQEIVSNSIGALGCATAINCPSSQVSGQSVMQVWVCHYGKSSGNTTTLAPTANSTNSTTPAPASTTTPLPSYSTTQPPPGYATTPPASAVLPPATMPDSIAAMPFSRLIRRSIPIVNHYDNEAETCDE